MTSHIPFEAFKVGASTDGKLVDIDSYAKEKNKKNAPIVYVVGAVAKGDPAKEADYVEECICISKFGLSASHCLFKIVNAYERLWNIEQN